MGWNGVPSMKYATFDNPRHPENTNHCCLPLSGGVVKLQYFVFYFERDILAYPRLLDPSKLHWYDRSLTHPWRTCVLPRPSMCLQLLVHPVQVTQCYQYVDRYDIMSRWSRSLLTILWLRAGELTLTHYLPCWSALTKITSGTAATIGTITWSSLRLFTVILQVPSVGYRLVNLMGMWWIPPFLHLLGL